MSAIVGLVMGVIMNYGALHHFGASPAEGFLAYLGGFIIGMLIVQEARK